MKTLILILAIVVIAIVASTISLAIILNPKVVMPYNITMDLVNAYFNYEGPTGSASARLESRKVINAFRYMGFKQAKKLLTKYVNKYKKMLMNIDYNFEKLVLKNHIEYAIDSNGYCISRYNENCFFYHYCVDDFKEYVLFVEIIKEVENDKTILRNIKSFEKKFNKQRKAEHKKALKENKLIPAPEVDRLAPEVDKIN